MNNDKAVIDKIAAELIAVEKQVYTQIMSDLSKDNPRPDAAACDKIFGIYTHAYLLPCVSQGFAFRAAVFSRKRLIPAVLGLERKLSVEFHKGALFYDTGLAHLVAGNENGYEYFLAMTDEEEFRKTGGGHPRGTVNLRSDGLAAQTVRKRMQFACDLLNGKVAAHTLDLAFATGIAPLDSAQFDGWRQKLNSLHQFELLRIIHDVEVFVGADYPNYSRVADNPFVMLRLAKALSHFAQWVESCLSHWQGGIVGTLSNKLQNDLDFGNRLSTCAGGGANFAGNNPPIAALDDQLRQLLADAAAAPAGDQRHWRLLRILYIVRNSTAHTIEPNLAIYQDRALLLSLLQVVFVSALVICQLKGRSLP